VYILDQDILIFIGSLLFSQRLNLNLLRVYYQESIANGQRKKLKSASHVYKKNQNIQ